MTDEAIASAKSDIESTTDLLERALAERLAASPDFAILDDFRRLRQEVSDGHVNAIDTAMTHWLG